MHNEPVLWETYSVWYIDIAGVKQSITMTALSAKDCREAFSSKNHGTGKTYLRCRVSRPATPKQLLAQKYGLICGSIKSAQIQLENTKLLPAKNEKLYKAHMLVDGQFAKLQRDIRDLFKLAGLNVK